MKQNKVFIFLLAAVMLVVFLDSAYSEINHYSANETANLVLLFHLNNESAFGENSTFFWDFSSYPDNGTCSGTGCPTLNTSCPFWNCYRFDGINDNILVKNTPSLTIINLTIEAWVKPSTLNKNQDIVSKYAANGYYLRLGSNNKYEFTGISGGTAALDQWAHVVGVSNGSNCQIYVDGNLTGTGANCVGTTAANLRIGSFQDGAQLFFNGTIDEVALYNRTLSAAEIKNHYLCGSHVNQSRDWRINGSCLIRSDEINISGNVVLLQGGTLLLWNGTNITAGGLNISPNSMLNASLPFKINITP